MNTCILDRLTYRNVDMNWSIQRVGTDYEFQQKYTLTGATQNIDIAIPYPIKINRVEYFSDDTTAKSFTTRIFNGDTDTVAYAQIANLLLDTNQSVLVLCEQDNLKYLQSPIVIRTAVSVSTLNKTLTIKICLERLDKIELGYENSRGINYDDGDVKCLK